MRPGSLLCGSDADDQPTPLDRLCVSGSASPPPGAVPGARPLIGTTGCLSAARKRPE